MLKYVILRLLGAIPTMMVIITVTFFMVRLAPGGPFDAERTLPPVIESNLRAKYRLDAPLVTQYAAYLRGVLVGDLGPSFKYQDYSVAALIGQGLPVSAVLGGAALLLAIGLGCGLGVWAGLRQHSRVDIGIRILVLAGVAIPSFVVAPLLTLVLGVYWGLLPVRGWATPAHAILPIIALALPYSAYIARLMRGSMIEVMQAPYMRTARAKGLAEWQLVWRHALMPALVPVLSYLGPAAAAVMTGSVVIEQIFGIPGIGRYFVQAALNRDYTMVMGVVIFYGALIVLFNLLVDLAYMLIDPKVRLA